MKQNSSRIFFIAVVFILAACATSAFGQNVPSVGGYRSANVEDKDVKFAADFAVTTKAKELKQKLELQSIAKAERQAVQGTNYRLCIEVYAPPIKEGEDGVTVWATVIVWRAPYGEMKLTKWEESDCNEQ